MSTLACNLAVLPETIASARANNQSCSVFRFDYHLQLVTKVSLKKSATCKIESEDNVYRGRCIECSSFPGTLEAEPANMD